MVAHTQNPVIVDLVGSQGTIFAPDLSLARPAWAKHIFKALFQNHGLKLLVYGGQSIVMALAHLKRVFEDKKSVLEEFHGTSCAGQFFESHLFNALPRNLPLLGFKAINSFVSFNEYATIQYAAVVQDTVEEVRQMKLYESKRQEIVLVDVRGTASKEKPTHYFGLITKPDGKDFTLQAGDKFDFQFAQDHTEPGISWSALVIDNFAVRQNHMTGLLITRPAQPGNSKIPIFEPEVVCAAGESRRTQISLISKAKTIKVKVKLMETESRITNVRSAMQHLNACFHPAHPRKLTAGPYIQRMHDVLMGNRPDQLAHKDLYGPVRQYWPRPITQTQPCTDPTHYMGPMNHDQRRVVRASRHLRGGLQIIQGPPGTGKTYTLGNLVSPFLASSRDGVVLIGAPTNIGANDIAKLLIGTRDRLIKDLEATHLAKRPILRAHAKKTEMEIVRKYKRLPLASTVSGLVSNVSPQNVRINTVEAEATEKHSLEALFLQQCAANPSWITGDHDDRVQNPELSIGCLMLKMAGIIPDPHLADLKTDYTKFRRIHDKHTCRQGLTTEEQAYWTFRCEILYKKAVLSASAIVGTTASISSVSILSTVQHKVTALFMDENAYEAEVSMAPLFATPFALDPCLVVIGDQLQIAPFTNARKEDNPLQPQLELSFMARQINIGMEFIMLREQFRMTDDIAYIANTLTYGDKLISSPYVSIANRPKARKFREFTWKLMDQDTNCFLMDIPPNSKNLTRKDSEKRSKGNDFFVCTVAQTVEQLLRIYGNTASIAILSAYKYQVKKYEVMLGRMRELELANHEKVTAKSFVGAQGRQYDIVIVELLVDKNVGFMANEKQLNVAMSRAKDGMIIVCDKAAAQEAVENSRNEGKYAQYLHDVIELLEYRTFTQRRQIGYPTTRYYTPKDH